MVTRVIASLTFYAANTTWTNWNSGQDTGTSTSTTAWNQWTAGTADNTGTIWYYWVGRGANGTISIPSVGYREPTAEEREAARLANEEQERRRKEAEARAEKILDENLDEDQRRAYAERKVVPIMTAKGRKYLIKKGRAGNVYRLDEHDREVEKFCIHPDEAVPDQDTMLGQLLWLRWMEKEFLETANKIPIAA